MLGACQNAQRRRVLAASSATTGPRQIVACLQCRTPQSLPLRRGAAALGQLPVLESQADRDARAPRTVCGPGASGVGSDRHPAQGKVGTPRRVSVWSVSVGVCQLECVRFGPNTSRLLYLCPDSLDNCLRAVRPRSIAQCRRTHSHPSRTLRPPSSAATCGTKRRRAGCLVRNNTRRADEQLW